MYDATGKLISAPNPNPRPNRRTGRMPQVKTAASDVVMLSGCRDDQTSADALLANKHSGAMSFALIQTLSAHRQQSFLALLKGCQDVMRDKRFTQIPQLSSCRPMGE